MKELDLLLERFARGPLLQATPAEQAGFEELLGLPDPQLCGYLLGGIDPPGATLGPFGEADPRLCRLRGPSALFSGATTLKDPVMLNFYESLQSIQLAARRPCVA